MGAKLLYPKSASSIASSYDQTDSCIGWTLITRAEKIIYTYVRILFPRLIMGVNLRITAHGFWRHAADFLHAADAQGLSLNGAVGKFRSRPSLVAYYLLGHSIELSLKAFLLAKGYEIRVLRDPKQFGHSVANLLAEARRRKLGKGVKLSKRECAAIVLLSETYKGKRLEYVEYGVYRLPEYFFLQAVAKS